MTVKLTAGHFRMVAEDIRAGREYYVCHGMRRAVLRINGMDWDTAREVSDPQVHELLRRDRLATNGDFDEGGRFPYNPAWNCREEREAKQERRAKWCDKIADELDQQEMLDAEQPD